MARSIQTKQVQEKDILILFEFSLQLPIIFCAAKQKFHRSKTQVSKSVTSLL